MFKKCPNNMKPKLLVLLTRLTNGKSNPVPERFPSWMYVEKVSEFHETSLLVLLRRLTNGKSKPVTSRLSSWMYVEKVSEYHETSLLVLLRTNETSEEKKR